MAGSQPNHHVTTSANYSKSVNNKSGKDIIDEAKKSGNYKSGEIITPAKAGKAVAEVAGKVIKAVSKTAEKTVSKNAEKAEEIAKNSVKVKPANKTNPTNERLNFSEDMRVKDMKSGDYAKRNMRLEEKRNSLHNQFFGKSKTIKIKGD
jgi:hypothetical protein